MKLLKWLFWALLFLVMLVAVDQFFLQVPPLHPAHGAVSRFYQDFRSRLVLLVSGETVAKPPTPRPDREQAPPESAPPESIESVIGDQQHRSPQSPPPQKPQRYLYSDAAGELQFADSLDEIPPRYRSEAQPLAE